MRTIKTALGTTLFVLAIPFWFFSSLAFLLLTGTVVLAWFLGWNDAIGHIALWFAHGWQNALLFWAFVLIPPLLMVALYFKIGTRAALPFLALASLLLFVSLTAGRIDKLGTTTGLVSEAVRQGNVRQARTPMLMLMNRFQHHQIAERLLQAGIDPNVRDDRGVTVLMSVNNQPEYVQLLVEQGAEVNARDHSGETALMGADARSTEILLKAGADPRATSNAGTTALHTAASRGDTETIRLLLQAGADVNARRKDGETPLLAALYLQRSPRPQPAEVEATVKRLLQAGADVNVANADGNTPLLLAVRPDASGHHYPEVVRSLLQAGARVNVRNRAGETPLSIAQKGDLGRSGSPELVKLLRQAER